LKLVLVGPVYPYRGGISHYTTQLSRALIDQGHDIRTFSFRRQYPSWLYPGVSDKETDISINPIEAKYLLDPIYPWTWAKTSSEIKKVNPEAVIVHWWTTFWAPAYWSIANLLIRSGLKVLYVIHNVAPHEPLPWDNWLARNVLKTGEAYIVQSKNEKNRLELLLPGAYSILCPHPIYYQFAGKDELSKVEARSRLGLNKEDPLILFFGIIRPYKGLKYALQAISILKEEGIIVRLLVAGEFWEDIEEYETLITDMDLSDQIVIFNRYIPNEQVALFFSAADIFIAPYVGGTQSGSVKIAMSFNLPIVATERISDDMLLNSEIVRIVPNEDSDALAEAIRELISADIQKLPVDAAPDNSWNELTTAIEKLVNRNVENMRGE
jgi:glycosyltransferase involved in cell wall biosynthesis